MQAGWYMWCGCHLSRSQGHFVVGQSESAPYLRSSFRRADVQHTRSIHFRPFYLILLEAQLRPESCWHDMAASSMPIPRPPGTPTPPMEEAVGRGRGNEGIASPTPARVAYNPNNLSPIRPDHPSGCFGGGMSAALSSSTTPSFYSPLTRSSRRDSQSARSDDGSGPFNFEPTTLAKSPMAKSVRHLPGLSLSPPVPHRRGS